MLDVSPEVLVVQKGGSMNTQTGADYVPSSTDTLSHSSIDSSECT
jgi:hypothetical protein